MCSACDNHDEVDDIISDKYEIVPLGEMSVTKVANTKSVTNNETYKVSFRYAENEEKFTFNMKRT